MNLWTDWTERYCKIRRGEAPKEQPDNFMTPVFDSSQRTSTEEIVFSRESIAVVIAEHDQPGDYGESDVVGVYVLEDGRFAMAEGSCDTSGWG